MLLMIFAGLCDARLRMFVLENRPPYCVLQVVFYSVRLGFENEPNALAWGKGCSVFC